MSQRSLFFLFASCTILVFLSFLKTMPREADILLTNGTIYTLDPVRPVAQALAIRGDRIVDIGTTEELRETFGTARAIDLNGKTVVPGFIDAHAHINGLGELMQSLILVGISSSEEVASLVRQRAAQLEPGRWIYGRGWDQNLWPTRQFPTRALLDEAAPNNPVILGRIDGHAIWVNTRAMQIAGVTRATADPEGGMVMRDAGRNPTGVFLDNARELIERVFPLQTLDEMEESIRLALEQCARAGLTAVHDMGDSAELVVFKRLADQGKLPVRVYAAVSLESGAWSEWLGRGPLIGHNMLTVRAVKVYMDGALGSRGAALFEEYADDPGNRGLTYMREDSLESVVRTALQHGFQPCTHAIGDRANHIVLNAYEKALASSPAADYRPRIEHAQVVALDDIPRFVRLGILPSMQPVHCTSDMYWAEARLGPQRIKGAYVWRSILDTGSPILGGSDFPNDDMDPLHGFYSAITRSDQTGYPAEGWYGRQRMSREEALKAFTVWAAYGAFQEEMNGTIEYGKYADLTVLSKDIMTVPPQEILSTEVEMTIVGGRVVYSKQVEALPQ